MTDKNHQPFAVTIKITCVANVGIIVRQNMLVHGSMSR